MNAVNQPSAALVKAAEDYLNRQAQTREVDALVSELEGDGLYDDAEIVRETLQKMEEMEGEIYNIAERIAPES